MMKLIALVVIAAGLVAADSPEYQVGDAFEATDDVAAALIADGSAKEPADAPVRGKKTKARLLVSCEHGNANDVVELSASNLKAAEQQGIADSSKGAVAYAMTLPQNSAAE